MNAQRSLTGVEPAPLVSDRIFFAIYPDAPAAERVARLMRAMRDRFGLEGRPIAPSRLHVTLQFLGTFAGVPAEVVAAAQAAAATVHAARFEFAFDCVVSFKGRPGDKPCVLLGSDHAAAAAALRRKLRAALSRFGLASAREKPFTPHVTLLYDTRSVAETSVEAIAWTAHEFALVHSAAGQGKHVMLGRWPLRDAARGALR